VAAGNTLDEVTAAWPLEIREDLRETLSKEGVIPSEKVATWLEMLGVDIGHLMIQLLPIAASYARAPVSNFRVGAVSLGLPPRPPIGGPGSLYLGSNMEFLGEALCFCIHAEQSATNFAWLHGEPGLQALAISAAPCGSCRQFLYELTTTTKGLDVLLKTHADPDDDSYRSNPLTYFLPDAFGPEDLGVEGGLMKPEDHGLTISCSDPTAQAALGGANASYAPYTKNYSGLALSGPNGQTYVGRYAENAAYNPSLSPLESALAAMNMSLLPQADLAIRGAILVEAQTDISQKGASEAVLSALAPRVALEVREASVPSGSR